MSKVAIYGAGGLGRVVHDILQASRTPVAAFFDSDAALHGQFVNGLAVVGDLDTLRRGDVPDVSRVIVAVGDNAQRAAVASEIRALGIPLGSAVHPSAAVAPSAVLSEHVIIGARVAVCVHARIERHAVISTGSIVEHDNAIGEAAFLHPAVRLAGGVRVEALATLGIGACVIPGRRIGRSAAVAPGAVVIRDVQAGTTVAGVPARRTDLDTVRFVAEPASDRDAAGARSLAARLP